MKLIVTIDVEEDNWGVFKPNGQTLDNVKRIPLLQVLFDRFGIKPTYLINYPVATDPYAIDLFKTYHAAGQCEIGMHCHPWNTPPYEEDPTPFNSMMTNLSAGLQFRKLKELRETIVNNVAVTPVSYRAGRWAFNAASARALVALGFKVDTSMMSYTNWAEFHGVDYGAVSPEPFRFNPDDIYKKEADGCLLQVPATVSFLQRNVSRANRMNRFMEQELGRRLRLKGFCHTLGLLNKVSLSPEKASARDMMALVDRMAEDGIPVVNMFFHSTTLKSGLGPFVRRTVEEAAFLKCIEDFLGHAAAAGLQPVTLAQFESSWSRSEKVRQGALQAPSCCMAK